MPNLPGLRPRPDPRTRELRIAHDGLSRRVLVRPPAEPSPAPWPAVLVFHGAGGSPELAAHATRFSEAADRFGFVAVYPEGLRPDPDKPPDFLRNVACWNNGSGFGYAAQVGADDVGFVAQLLDVLLEQWPIDPQRIFATGFSNGAGMAARATAELSDRLAGVAPVSGHLWTDTPPDRPRPMLAICGDADPIHPLDGGPVATPWGQLMHLPPARETVRRWAVWCGCDSAARLMRDDGIAREFVFDPLPATRRPVPVHWVIVRNCGHTWPGGRRVLAERIAGPHTRRYDATQQICTFFGLCGDGSKQPTTSSEHA